MDSVRFFSNYLSKFGRPLVDLSEFLFGHFFIALENGVIHRKQHLASCEVRFLKHLHLIFEEFSGGKATLIQKHCLGGLNQLACRQFDIIVNLKGNDSRLSQDLQVVGALNQVHLHQGLTQVELLNIV